MKPCQKTNHLNQCFSGNVPNPIHNDDPNLMHPESLFYDHYTEPLTRTWSPIPPIVPPLFGGGGGVLMKVLEDTRSLFWGTHGGCDGSPQRVSKILTACFIVGSKLAEI